MTIEYEPITPPGRLDTLQELRLPIDMLRWAPGWLAMKSRRAARPHTAILLPGFGAGPRSMRIMESFLRRRGHRASDWGLGLNTGDVKKLRAKLKHVVEESMASHGEPVVLVGWSLGGYIAREYAREHPGDVRKVVTLGSPVIGGPRYTSTAARYRSQGFDLAQIERDVANRYATPLRVPVVAIYSKRDGIVAWRACIDQWSPHVRNIEVSATHFGLVLAPRVLAIVADEVERDGVVPSIRPGAAP
jgi:pimeloyl-ACP methyl ester carboxylesterase